MADPDPIFTEAPEEVRRYFETKSVRPSFDWRDVAPEEHAHTFTVAKSAGYDILGDLQASLAEANRTYGDFGSFMDDVIPTLQKKGWWGRRNVVDPVTGETVNVQLGSLRRLRTIYWANIRTARAAGEWERTVRTKALLPFLVYRQSTAENRRPEHTAWVGTILPVDHPWWKTHYPPNGWLCQCGARQVGKRAAERMGYDPDAAAPAVEARPWTNKRTGETVDVPRGIDPGWQQNPGANRARNLADHMTGQLEAMPPERRRTAISDLVGSQRVQAILRGDIPFNGRRDVDPANRARGRMSVPIAAVPEDVSDILGAPPRIVQLSNEDVHKQRAERLTRQGDQQLRPADYAIVQRILDEGRLFEERSGGSELTGQIEIDGAGWVAVFHLTQTRRAIYLKSFRRIGARRIGETDRIVEIER